MAIDPTEHRHGAGDLSIADSPEGRVPYCVVCGERFIALSQLAELTHESAWEKVAAALKAAGHLVNPKPRVEPPPTPPPARTKR